MGANDGDRLLKLIVECDIGDESEAVISELCRVKYSLPAFGCYIVEVPVESYKKVSGLSGIRAVHKSTGITAQIQPGAAGVLGGTGHGPAHEHLTGKGIGIAILDTGIGQTPDFCEPDNRIFAFKDFVDDKPDPYDDNAHGTHVAGIAAGNGSLSGGLYTGVAPGSGIIGVKILDRQGRGDTAEVMAGIQWIITNKEKYNIRVVNLSVGTADIGGDAPMVRAVETAWDKGIVVCAAAGNNGPAACSITSPGISRKIITVGSSDDHKSVSIWGNNLVNFSGRGPTSECVIKPDIIAPGTDIISCLCPAAYLSDKRRKELDLSAVPGGYVRMSGTSMSTPMVSGAVALMLEKHPNLKPNDVKYLLMKSAADMNYPRNHQGWGALNIKAFLEQEV